MIFVDNREHFSSPTFVNDIGVNSRSFNWKPISPTSRQDFHRCLIVIYGSRNTFEPCYFGSRSAHTKILSNVFVLASEYVFLWYNGIIHSCNTYKKILLAKERSWIICYTQAYNFLKYNRYIKIDFQSVWSDLVKNNLVGNCICKVICIFSFSPLKSR